MTTPGTYRENDESPVALAPHRSQFDRPRDWVLVAAIIAVVIGVALRAWFIFHDPTNSDEAVAGLIARQILHGHTYAFFWGQPVGGVEPYALAAFLWLFGPNGQTLALAPVTLSVVAALLVWRVARRLVKDPALAVLAGALTWASPLAAVYNSTVEGGYRGVTLACGLAALLIALRILDGEMRYREFVMLGLVAGVGWWALPEIVYFLLPAGLLVASAIVRWPKGLRFDRWVGKLGVCLLASCAGALPWLWANVQSGFASLDPSKFPGTVTPLNPGMLGRLRIFFVDALPLQLNLRRFDDGRWLFGVSGSSPLHRVLLVAVVAVVLAVVVLSVVLCFLRGGRAVAVGAAVVAYPFLVALQPMTWFWIDGRYTVYTGALLSLSVVIGVEEGVRRFRRRERRDVDRRDARRARSGFSIVVTGSVLLALLAFHQSFGVTPSSFATGWGDPDQATRTTIASLERQGVRTGYADYWVAYKLDLLSGGSLAITVAGADPDRWQALDHQVSTSADPAWLFVPATQMSIAHSQFDAPSEIRGPGGLDEASFTAMLRQRKIPYRVIDARLIQAVVPVRPVSRSVANYPTGPPA